MIREKVPHGLATAGTVDNLARRYVVTEYTTPGIVRK